MSIDRLRAPLLTDVQSVARTFVEWARVLNPIVSHEVIRGRIMTATLASGTTAVSHGLGRIPQHFWATPDTASVTISNPGGHTDKFLYVQASGACDASIQIV